MQKNSKTYYEKQKYLIDLAIKILKQGFSERKQDLKDYQDLFFLKSIPPHIMQPLQSLRNKITFKAPFSKIEKELNVSHYKAKKLIEMHGFSFILENLQEIKEEFSKINSLNWGEFKYLNLNLEKKLKK